MNVTVFCTKVEVWKFREAMGRVLGRGDQDEQIRTIIRVNCQSEAPKLVKVHLFIHLLRFICLRPS